MLTPQKSSIRKYARLATKKKSLLRRPIDPSTIPNVVQDTVVRQTTNARAGSECSAGRKWSRAAPTPKPKTETSSPFANTGTPRPRNTASRFAGEASSGPSVPNQRSFATAIVIP